MTDAPRSHTGQTDIGALSYEQAREELVTTVRSLEAGNLTLEESLSLWKRGEALADRCQAWLDGARDTLSKVQQAREDRDSNTASGDADSAGTGNAED